VAVDPETGMSWIEKAARQGDPVAQTQYGTALANGIAGVPRLGEGIGWIARAAEQGHVDALMTMGTVYAQGILGEADIVMAYKWFRLAANMGEERAMQITGAMKQRMMPEQLARSEKMVREWTQK